IDRFGWFVICVEGADERGAELTLSERGLAALLASPLMDHCVGLTLPHVFLKLKAVRRLAESPGVKGLFSLDLRGNQVGAQGAAALANSSAFPNLRALGLDWVNAGPAGVTALAASTHFKQLRELDLDGNRLDPASVEALAGSSAFPRLERLSLGKCKIGNEPAR